MTANAPFVTTEYIRWEDIDLAGIARYSAYPRFIDVAETDLYRSLGMPLSKLHERYRLWLPRKVMHIEYFSPARLDDQVVIVAYFSNIGRSAVTMNVDILRDDRRTLIAAAHLVMVCVDMNFTKLALPPEFRELVERHIMSTEEARASI